MCKAGERHGERGHAQQSGSGRYPAGGPWEWFFCPGIFLLCLSPTASLFALFMTLVAFSAVYPVVCMHAPDVKNVVHILKCQVWVDYRPSTRPVTPCCITSGTAECVSILQLETNGDLVI